MGELSIKDRSHSKPFLTPRVAGGDLRHFLIVVANVVCEGLKLLHVNTDLPAFPQPIDAPELLECGLPLRAEPVVFDIAHILGIAHATKIDFGTPRCAKLALVLGVY